MCVFFWHSHHKKKHSQKIQNKWICPQLYSLLPLPCQNSPRETRALYWNSAFLLSFPFMTLSYTNICSTYWDVQQDPFIDRSCFPAIDTCVPLLFSGIPTLYFVAHILTHSLVKYLPSNILFLKLQYLLICISCIALRFYFPPYYHLCLLNMSWERLSDLMHRQEAQRFNLCAWKNKLKRERTTGRDESPPTPLLYSSLLVVASFSPHFHSSGMKTEHGSQNIYLKFDSLGFKADIRKVIQQPTLSAVEEN